ncbi:hypothetical protein LINGRAHAP2_LOCUS33587, partial [Linum grandiflorum]
MVLLQAWALERFPSIAQRTHDDRRRRPDGQEYPRLRRWAGWIREKVRLARVTEYRQLFDEGTPVTWLPYIGEEEYT